jgi:hypothetical protein
MTDGSTSDTLRHPRAVGRGRRGDASGEIGAFAGGQVTAVADQQSRPRQESLKDTSFLVGDEAAEPSMRRWHGALIRLRLRMAPSAEVIRREDIRTVSHEARNRPRHIHGSRQQSQEDLDAVDTASISMFPACALLATRQCYL